MKRLFFDTSVYNHITDTDIDCVKHSTTAGELEVLTTPQILAELAGTFKKDKDRATKLCKIYGHLISENVLQPPPILIKTEIGALLSGHAKILYLEGENKAEFFTYVEKLKNGNLDLYTEQFVDRIGRLKKEQRIFSKLGFSKVETHVVKEPLKKYPTFDPFLKEGVRRGERLKELERYVVTDLGENAHKAAKFIEKRLHKTPHLAIALRIVPALSYYYHVQKNKPKHGDIFDCGHFVCLATVDGFVSDDEGARDLFRLVCPHKQSLSLADLINLLAQPLLCFIISS
jgi:hypothetical protein